MTIREQIKNITPILIIAFAATIALLSAVVLLGIESGVDLDNFTQDPTAIMMAPFYLGFFSNIGIVLWCASAAICFLSASVLPKSGPAYPISSYLVSSGLITTLLMFDDFLLLHEEVFPNYFHIPENSVLLVYINFILIHIIVFRYMILKTEYILIALAIAMVGISKAVAFVPMPIPEDSFLEDAVKFFGIVAWFIYFTRLGYFEIIKRKTAESEN